MAMLPKRAAERLRKQVPMFQNIRHHAVLLITCVFMLVILAFWVATPLLIPWYTKKPIGPGEFGDMFGAVNALFSGFAFLGIVVAIFLQKNELELQRAELEQTRGELAGQREQLELQNATFQQQSFDNKFFQMLALHRSIVEGIDMDYGGTKKTGRDCFVAYYRDLEDHIRHHIVVGLPNEKARWAVAYNSIYGSHQHDLGHYFRDLYHIIKYIDRSSVDDRRFYTNLVRAQLSSHELLLLFYNCSVGLGQEKFKPLVEKYGLLKNMPKDQLQDASHADWFDATAYKGTPTA